MPPPDDLSADDVADLLGLEPLPGEGGRWAQTHLDATSSAIYFLLAPGDFSALHRLPGDEIYHHYAGDPAELGLLHPDGSHEVRVVGDDLAAGLRPTLVVRAGTWQGSRTLGRWTLLGTTMAPPFSFEGLEVGDREALRQGWPAAGPLIDGLTRPEVSR